MTDTAYVTSRVKRSRATRVEMAERREQLLHLVEVGQPMTVRHAYYRAVVAGIVEKDHSGYLKVQRALQDMREAGEMPFSWISDNTRWMRKGTTWTDIDAFLANAAASYRRNLWAGADDYVEVWCESDSIAGVISDVTVEWDVPLMPVKGFSSISFAHSAAEKIKRVGKPTFIYYVGDRDPAGLEIEHNLQDALARYAPDEDIFWERVGVTEEQVLLYDLPGTPPKKRTSCGRPFTGDAVEAEALPAPVLRELIENAIVQHLDRRHLELVLLAEEEERGLLVRMARREVA